MRPSLHPRRTNASTPRLTNVFAAALALVAASLLAGGCHREHDISPEIVAPIQRPALLADSGSAPAVNGKADTPKLADPKAAASTLTPAQAKELEQLTAKLKAAATLSEAYAAAEKIEDLGVGALPSVLALLKDLGITPRTAACRAVATLGDSTRAVKELCAIVAEDGDKAARLAASELLSAVATENHKKTITEALDKTFDIPLQIELCVVLYDTSRAPRAKKQLEELLGSDSANFRLQAALGLGRCKDLTRCRDLVEAIAGEPTDRGSVAREILRRDRVIKELEQIATRADAEPAGNVQIDTRLLDKVTRMVQQRYIYAEKVTARRLALAAASGVLSGLDSYSAYLDGPATRRASEIRRFTEPGLGFSLGSKKLRGSADFMVPTIVSVLPGSPAEHAGLRAGDHVLNAAPNVSYKRLNEWMTGIDPEHGETIEDFLDLRLGQAVGALLGEPGTSIGLLVRRDGWLTSRWVYLEREPYVAPAFASEMLPGSLGYVRFAALDAPGSDAFAAALKSLKTDGAKGLLLDLRDCSGGSLDAAARVAGLLLAENAVIASSVGRDEALAPAKTYAIGATEGRDTTIPVTVLVNGGTADAAEVAAFALAEHKRAKVVGSKTFGRAILQELLPVEAEVPGAKPSGEEGRIKQQHSLLLTVGYVSTPVSKRRISESGLTPDVAVSSPSYDAWVYDEIAELEATKLLRSFAEGIIARDLGTAQGLAKDDGKDTSRYAGWKEFRALKSNHLSDEQVRAAVRRELRAELAKIGKLPAGADLEADAEFVAGLKQLAEQSSVDLKAIKEYSTISAK